MHGGCDASKQRRAFPQRHRRTAPRGRASRLHRRHEDRRGGALRIEVDPIHDSEGTHAPPKADPLPLHAAPEHPHPAFTPDISRHREEKRAAILVYRCLVIDHEPNRWLPEELDPRDRFLGSRLGVEAAEPFWCCEVRGVGSQLSIVRGARTGRSAARFAPPALDGVRVPCFHVRVP